MSNAETDEKLSERTYPATVAEVLDHGMVVLNRGASHGVKEGQRFLIYELTEKEIEDPDSGEILGRLERVKATGTVVNVQDKMCTLELAYDELPVRRHVNRRSPFQAFPGVEREPASSEMTAPFEHPAKIGDKAKPIRS